MGEEIFIESDELNNESTVPLTIQCLQIEIPSTKISPCALKNHRTRLINFLKACRSIKISPFFPSTIFQQTIDNRRNFRANFIEKMNFFPLMNLFKEWIKHPMNIALLIWFICVASSSSMQALLLLGMLNKEFPQKSSQNRWIEINNQVLNALFTLMSLYQHPSLCHQLVLLCRWRSQDIIELRNIHCKKGISKPNEWAHMMVIVILLQITCFSQYVLCGLYWGYTKSKRPQLFGDFFNAIGFLAPSFAAGYAMYSPLGREENSTDSEHSETVKLESSKDRNKVVKPVWNGGVFECKDDVSVTLLSFLCCFCVFGWNMERLGFGNMYVHIALFFMLCFAPIWIFGVASMNISNDWVRNVVGISGLVLSLCGLIYGGFWRLKMRKRFKLGGDVLCCGSETLNDYLQWLLCCCCSLAQEVRTGNFYEVEEGSFYRKDLGGEDEFSVLICPLPCESRASFVNDAKMPPLQQLIEGV